MAELKVFIRSAGTVLWENFGRGESDAEEAYSPPLGWRERYIDFEHTHCSRGSVTQVSPSAAAIQARRG